MPDGDRYIVTAGNAGSDRHRAWYHNLVDYRAQTTRPGPGTTRELDGERADPSGGSGEDRDGSGVPVERIAYVEPLSPAIAGMGRDRAMKGQAAVPGDASPELPPARRGSVT